MSTSIDISLTTRQYIPEDSELHCKYMVIYHPGKENIADCLSRLLKIDKIPVPNCHNDDVKLIVRRLVETVIPNAVTSEEIQIATGQDMELQRCSWLFTVTFINENMHSHGRDKVSLSLFHSVKEVKRRQLCAARMRSRSRML
jgi:hypothetical protein